jgi:hypothetical protein
MAEAADTSRRPTMTRSGIAIAIAASLGLIAAPASAKPKPVDSWGRADVDFDTYRVDAIECTSDAYYADVSQTKQAKAFLRGTRLMEATDGMPMDYLEIARRYAQIENAVRPELQFRQLRNRMQDVVDDCLIDRGYSQFRLTESQRKQLSKLKKGTAERHHFLHDLASDPDVLQEQPVPVAAG